MKPIALFICLQILVLLMACSPAQPGQDQDKEPLEKEQPAKNQVQYSPGKITDDPAGYSFYLPKAYSAEQSWPIIYFFDAHARAHLPLEKYEPLAEMMGWILAASSLSQNGQQPAQSIDISANMINSLQQKLKIDGRRQYTGGFSGGARVAAMVAQNRTDINGVIACGAGYQPAESDQFDFAGMVGMEDFNYQEFVGLERILDQIGKSHLIEYFDGGHEWAHYSEGQHPNKFQLFT